MEVNTLNNIVKYIFIIGIIGVLIYIVFYMRKINTNNWIIEGSDDKLTFTSPKKTMMFSISEKDNGIIVKNHLIKSSSDNLEFIDSSNNSISSLNKKEFRLGGVAITDSTDNPNSDIRGVHFSNTRINKPIVYISDHGLLWPEQNMLLKSDHGPKNPQFQVHDLTNSKIVLAAPSSVQESNDIVRSYY